MKKSGTKLSSEEKDLKRLTRSLSGMHRASKRHAEKMKGLLFHAELSPEVRKEAKEMYYVSLFRAYLTSPETVKRVARMVKASGLETGFTEESEKWMIRRLMRDFLKEDEER
jgi:hypothetical protein